MHLDRPFGEAAVPVFTWTNQLPFAARSNQATRALARMMANGGRMALTCQSPMLAGMESVYNSTQIEEGESMQCQQTILLLFFGSYHYIILQEIFI